VIIPASNVQNLMLDEETIQAVRGNLFHIYAVNNVDEAIEILTGMKAGRLLEDGAYEPDTLKARVDEKIKEASEMLKKIADTIGDEKKEATNDHQQ